LKKLSADGVVGLSFGRVADVYERARPEYDDRAIDHVVRELGLGADATVLDLAAGTGKLTRALAGRFAHVIAVEPDDAMRAKIDGDARAGTAEAIPVDDASVDGVFVGDAFHWFDAATASGEIRRVLRPGGGLALLWNQWSASEAPAAKEIMEEVWRRFHGDTTFTESAWMPAVEEAFGPFAQATIERELRVSGDRYADLFITASCPSALPDAERADLRRRLRAELGDEYVLSVPTYAYWART
jgi:ubiquinone/menaquinone biosynthesis C-methylase UbiE